LTRIGQYSEIFSNPPLKIPAISLLFAIFIFHFVTDCFLTFLKLHFFGKFFGQFRENPYLCSGF